MNITLGARIINIIKLKYKHDNSVTSSFIRVPGSREEQEEEEECSVLEIIPNMKKDPYLRILSQNIWEPSFPLKKASHAAKSPSEKLKLL